MNIAIVFAGGSGVRMGAGIPKQFIEIEGQPVLIYTLKQFQYHRRIDKIYLSVKEDYIPYAQALVDEYRIGKVAGIVPGGETSQDSIYIALKRAAEENPDDSIVLLHDGVRPFITYDVISENIKSVKKYGNAVTCTPCFETVLMSGDGIVVDAVPNRKETFSAQAPQSFYLRDIISYHDQVRASETGYENMVDACTIMTSLGVKAHLVKGNRGNIKVTTPEDVYMFRALLQYKKNDQIFGFGLTGHATTKMRHAMDKLEKWEEHQD